MRSNDLYRIRLFFRSTLQKSGTKQNIENYHPVMGGNKRNKLEAANELPLVEHISLVSVALGQSLVAALVLLGEAERDEDVLGAVARAAAAVARDAVTVAVGVGDAALLLLGEAQRDECVLLLVPVALVAAVAALALVLALGEAQLQKHQ